MPPVVVNSIKDLSSLHNKKYEGMSNKQLSVVYAS